MTEDRLKLTEDETSRLLRATGPGRSVVCLSWRTDGVWLVEDEETEWAWAALTLWRALGGAQ